MSKRRADERGDAAVEAVLVTPVLLLLIGVVIHFALWFHASQIARSATQEGARTARVLGGTASAGHSTVERFVAQVGPSLVLNPTISVDRTPTETTVDLHAHSVAVIPGLQLPIHARTVIPSEGFRPAL